jgi:hypothetical protein
MQVLDYYTLGAGSLKITDLKKARIAEAIAQTDF